VKIRCERDRLVDSLGTVSRAVTGRGVAATRPGLLLESDSDQLHLVGHDTNLDLVIESRIETAVLSPGSAVLPSPLVTDIVRALPPGAVTIEADDDEANITAGRSEFAVRTYPVMDFPRLPAVEGDWIKLQSGAFGEAMRQVVRAAAAEGDKAPTFTGVLMSDEGGALRLVATDSYRLAFKDVEGSAGLGEGRSVLVPARALNELQRLLGASEEKTLSFHAGDLYAAFEVSPVRMLTRIIKADFPEYRHLAPPSYPNSLVIEREPFLDALRRMRLLVRDANKATPVRMSMSVERVVLTVSNAEYGKASEEVDGRFEGSELTIAFNPGYLIDGLEGVRGDEVMVETVDDLKPAMIRGVENGDYRYLLMPVKVGA
jgi:DNA polymerase-3 subunit beta